MSGHRRAVRVFTVAVVLLVLAGAGLYASIPLLVGPAPAPLGLPAPAASGGTSASSIEGTWTAGTGSMAGYRVRASILGQGGDVVGRTSTVSGTVTIAANAVVSASMSVDLTTIELGGKPQPQLARIMDTGADPNATFTLTAPVALGPTPVIGTTLTVGATGHLVMNGVSHSVTASLAARDDGTSLAVVGSIPILFSDWGIVAPWGLEDHGAIEFLVILARSGK
jgi:polyisoprenoid-binding protein YceI